MGKERRKRSRLHEPLAQQILGDRVAKSKSIEEKKSRKKKAQEEEQEFVDNSLSRKILMEARMQQEELEEEFGVASGKKKKVSSGTPSRLPSHLSLETTMTINSESEEDDGSVDENASVGVCPVIDEDDERALRLFMRTGCTEQRTLADIIMEKIKEKETEIASHLTETQSLTPQMDERVVRVFRSVGIILSRYRAGKLPKAFKVIPSLCNWEEILHLTNPDKWTASAMLQATRIFTSNLSAIRAQRFLNLVLLPRLRDDITEYKRLNFHLYTALKKSLFKPAAFFKGLLLPLCESGTCTLREALIISSVLAKTSVPVLHSSAALLKLAEMDYSGANSIFIRALLDKKYALPFRVVDALVFHFSKFKQEVRPLPVLWHQCLLTFVQRYKEDISMEQKEALLELIRTKSHHEISPEIRREIVHSNCRDLGEKYINKMRV